MEKQREFILYGLGDFPKILDEIAKITKGILDEFDLQLILSESLSNAFIHGNNSDDTKPIYLRLKLEDELIRFEIEDSGAGKKEFKVPEEISDENILDDHGRGLFLLKCFTDSMDFYNNTLFLTKKCR